MSHPSRRELLVGAAAGLVCPRVRAEPSPLAVVLVLLRGAADGLGLAPLLRDPRMASLRPDLDTTAIALPLDDQIGLHPALAATHRRLRAGEGALLLGVGPAGGGRSHFEAQDALEVGGAAGSGWLNRVLLSRGATDPLAGVALTPTLPLSLAGPGPGLSLSDPSQVGLGAAARADARRLYVGSADPAAPRALAGLDALDRLARLPPDTFVSGGEAAAFPNAARLVGLGSQAVFVELGAWDTHVRQGAADGQLAKRLTVLDRGLDLLLAGLGGRALVVVLTEFGRTAAQNGSGGTDHGHGTVGFVFGPGTRGPVLGAVPDLGRLHEGRDLPVGWTHTEVLAAVSARLGVGDVNGGAAPAPIFAPGSHG